MMEFVVENIFPQIKEHSKETGIKEPFHVIRIALFQENARSELPDAIFLLGREKSIKHNDRVLTTL